MLTHTRTHKHTHTGDSSSKGSGGMPGGMPGMPPGMEEIFKDPEVVAAMENPKIRQAMEEMRKGACASKSVIHVLDNSKGCVGVEHFFSSTYRIDMSYRCERSNDIEVRVYVCG